MRREAMILMVGLPLATFRSLNAGDCNGNGIDDRRDIDSGTSHDCNENGLPDECDVSPKDFVFKEEAKAAIGAHPVEIYPADLDADGQVDLVVVVRGSNEEFTLRNLGGFTFGPPQPLPLDVYQPIIAAADFDGDAHVGLAAVAPLGTELSILRNNGAGAFLSPQTIESGNLNNVLAADLDGDGDIDLATSEGFLQSQFLHVFFNRGDATFDGPSNTFAGDYLGAIVAGDFDRDGLTDLAFNTDQGQRGAVLFGSREPDGAGGFVTTFGRLEHFLFGGYWLVAADLDGDGDLDLAGSGYTDDYFHVTFNEGDGSFESNITVPLKSGPRNPVTGDFDGDGDVDLAVACEPSGEVLILLNRGDGRFQDPVSFRTTERAYALRSLDLDGDGRLDLLAANSNFETATYVSALLNRTERSLMKDCDANGILDECEPDCDGDGTPDVCAIAAGAPDADGNGIPDACDPDCNGNGVPDAGDIKTGLSKDCNANGIPDECDLAPSFGFPGPTRLASAGRGSFATSADFDGDADVDIAVAATQIHEMALFRNRGNRTFADPVGYPAGLYPSGIASGDLDSDGDSDLVVTNAQAATASVLKNDGKGRFRLASTFLTGEPPWSVRLADINSDGSLDAVVAGGTYINDGHGLFAAGQSLPLGEQILLEDLDGDGDVDLVAPDSFGMFRIFLNTRDSAVPFSTPIQRGAGVLGPFGAIDVDGDGDRDIVIAAGEFFLIRNLGGGSFDDVEKLGLSGSGNYLGTWDLNGDGVLDLFLSEGDSISIRHGEAGGGLGDPILYSGLGFVTQILPADLDGDADPDLIANASLSGELLLFWNDGTGQMAAGREYPVGQGPWRLLAADFDGDGDLDLVTANLFADNLSFLEGHGNGTYEEARPIDGISSAVDLVADDADHDGDVDLILTNNGLTLARNRGNGDFIAETMGGEFTATAILPFDFDGDGDRDLAVTRANGEPVILLRANGDGTYGDQSSVEEEVEPNGLESVDLDGDGDLDLVSSHSIPPGLTRYLNNGAGAFTKVEGTLAVGDLPGKPLGLDIDGDGDQDLSVVSQTSSTLAIWHNSGGGGFRESMTYPCGDEPNGLVAADLDRDGHADLVASNHDGHFLSVFRNNGQGGFYDEVRLPARSWHYTLIADYLDGDGDIDLAVANVAGTISVFLNQSDHFSVIDCDGNGIRDEFDLKVNFDCNRNEIPDRVDIFSRRSADCDNDDVPDECELADGTAFDVNENGILDYCENVPFHRGDPNDNGKTDISDPIYILAFLFLGNRSPTCFESADTNNDGRIDLSDAVGLLTFLFLDGRPPALPGPPTSPCGDDPDDLRSQLHLGCAAYENCAASGG